MPIQTIRAASFSLENTSMSRIWKTFDNLWSAVEYNYLHKKHNGHSQDIVPGLIWKFTKTSTFSIGVLINIDYTLTDKDEIGIILKLAHKW